MGRRKRNFTELCVTHVVVRGDPESSHVHGSRGGAGLHWSRAEAFPGKRSTGARLKILRNLQTSEFKNKPMRSI